MKKLEIEVFKTAFQIELEESEWVFLYVFKETRIYTQIAFWNHEDQNLESFDGTNCQIDGKMVGWSKMPLYS